MESPSNEELRAYMQAHGLNASQLARLVFVTPRAALSWYRNERAMSAGHWALLQHRVEGKSFPAEA